ncbi:Dynamin-1-like protein [Hypsibius exemplaris]|uniref:Dynamin-1-like protein n=1 Tax=Hypsibius exemplaris TaxID=2072580 RepID=A0A1W0WRZ1_HYPEX|nr:Dynamin-1-like protein [Hypsibius exemplaris]
MEQFSEIFNKLQSVIQVVGTDISFPQIVVVGSQSDGKSSVLESIVKNGFLPRGTGIVTRTPIILQLKNVPGDDRYAEVTYDLGGREGMVVRQLTDFNEVAFEIQTATAKLAGTSLNIVNKPITVVLRSSDVPDLTLVDLPGLVENPAGDQPKDIKRQVGTLVREYVENKNAIILAVHQATTDLANSKSLNLAREVDPEGKRTICVVTKLDLVEPVMRVIGVINRSQTNSDNPRWTNADQTREEEAFFRKYKKIAFDHGTKVLSDYLSMVFREHIRKCMPQLKNGVDELVADNQAALEALGKSIADEEETGTTEPDPQRVAVINVINDFCRFLRGSLEGNVDQGSKEVRGGAKLEDLFNNTYWDALGAIVALDNVSEVDTWTTIRNSWGAERQMFLSIKAFNILVRKEMERMLEESLRCVGLAHQEMLTIRDFAGKTIENIRVQFPNLHARIMDIVASYLEVKLKETRSMVENCVLMQLDYVNVKHPDFTLAQQHAAKRFSEVAALLEAANKEGSDGATKPVMTLQRPLNTATGRASSPMPTRQPANRLAGSDSESEQEGGGGSKKDASGTRKTNGYMSSQPTLTKKDKLDCEITMELVRRYFDVIRSIVRDSVPKVIMRFMVNEVKNKVEGELLSKLTTREAYAPLLKESETIATKRRELKEKLDAYQQAAVLVRELGTA